MQTSGYEFAAEPRSVPTKRIKPRKSHGDDPPQNLMFDRRVHRGSAFVVRDEASIGTYLHETKGNNNIDPPKKHKTKSSGSPQKQYQLLRPTTPPAIDGRLHMDIQTESYLEELTDRNPEVDVETQTDALLDLQLPVFFVPQPSGIDVATQIETGDLFNFDLEVEPILQVLVGKTLEISFLEVMEEAELKELRRRQEIFEQARNAELVEVQRLEAEAKRKLAEKSRRLEEEQIRLDAQGELEEKIAARAHAKAYLADLHTQVFDGLVKEGHFSDPLHTAVRENAMPELVDNALLLVQRTQLAQILIDSVLADLLNDRSRK